jgi:hypothetical protein
MARRYDNSANEIKSLLKCNRTLVVEPAIWSSTKQRAYGFYSVKGSSALFVKKACELLMSKNYSVSDLVECNEGAYFIAGHPNHLLKEVSNT